MTKSRLNALNSFKKSYQLAGHFWRIWVQNLLCPRFKISWRWPFLQTFWTLTKFAWATRCTAALSSSTLSCTTKSRNFQASTGSSWDLCSITWCLCSSPDLTLWPHLSSSLSDLELVENSEASMQRSNFIDCRQSSPRSCPWNMRIWILSWSTTMEPTLGQWLCSLLKVWSRIILWLYSKEPNRLRSIWRQMRSNRSLESSSSYPCKRDIWRNLLHHGLIVIDSCYVSGTSFS